MFSTVFSRLATASDRLKKLHELVSMAHQQSTAFAGTADNRQTHPPQSTAFAETADSRQTHPPVTGTRLETNRTKVTQSLQQPRATSETSRDAVPTTGNTDNSPIAVDDLSKERQWNR